MRIALVISSLAVGGAERVLTTMSNYWVGHGHDIHVITLAGADRDVFILDPRVRRTALNLMQDSAGKLQGVTANLKRVFSLRRAVLSAKPEVVISFNDKTNVLVIASLVGTGVPVIAREESDPRHFPISRGWEKLRRMLYPRAAAVVVLSEQLRPWAREFLPNEKIIAIPNPLPCPQTESGSDTPRIPRPAIAALGRLDRFKAFDRLIKAFVETGEEFRDWNLVIIGDGVERDSLSRLAKELGLEHRVHLAGRVQNPQSILNQAEFFVSTSQFEGFGLAIAEAMACGLPAVAYDCPIGPREIIRDGIDGFLIPLNNSHALADCMRKLMRNPELRQSLAAQAPAVLERFGVETVMAQYEQLIMNTVGKATGQTYAAG